MKCWAKNEVNMGIDTIELMIETDKPLRVNGENVNVLDLICKKTKQKVGTIKHKKGRRKGYCLNINLPKCKYEDNKKTFGKEDSSDLPKIYKMIKNKLDSLFGEGFYKVEVLACEVSATAKLDNYKNVDAILNMIKLMLLQDGKSFCIWVHGKKYNSKDCHNEKLITKDQVESIKTKCSNNRYSVHLYNKGLEQGCIEQGLLRIEFRYNSSGLNYAKTGNTIESFLTASGLEKIIKVFRKDYKKYFIHRYWSDKNGNKFYKLRNPLWQFYLIKKLQR